MHALNLSCSRAVQVTAVRHAQESVVSERMFSKVDLTLSDIRSTMSEERLEALVLLQAHRRRVSALATTDIVQKFATKDLADYSFHFHCSGYFMFVSSIGCV